MEPLKNMYNPEFFERLCPIMRNVIPGFDCRDFIFRIFNNTWPDLELKERVRQITHVLHHFMPKDFTVAAGMITELAAALREGASPEQGFATIFLPDYIQVFGLDFPDQSMDALEKITDLVSAEFAIRPFIIRYPDKTMKRMLSWSNHSSSNVRRLSSEGCRPRLPWAMGLPEFKKDPQLILPILENLKMDTSEYVRRSVANNLNDIAKDHPELVLRIAKKWKGKNEETDRIIKHACRTLLKKGNIEALALHGYDHKTRAAIDHLSIEKKKIKVGEVLNFSFQFVSKEKKISRFRLEYVIDYITASGKISRKVFKISENEFKPGLPIQISRKQSFKNLTTRKHFKGKHSISILVNGNRLASSQFLVT
jgi:3-methyladenine DNA glycosylase AlkC